MDEIPRISWDRFVQVFNWKQGEHVSLIGTTGAGKTNLGLQLMKRRKYTVVLGTKPKDPTLSAMCGKGKEWSRIKSWDESEPIVTSGLPNRLLPPRRYMLWPSYRHPDDLYRHRGVFADALQQIWVEQAWTIFGDEAFYLKKYLALEPLLEQYWTQGRSLGISLVTATQRPAHVPLLMYSQASHVFLWKTTDKRDRKRLLDIAGDIDRDLLDREVARLDSKKYETIWVSTKDGRMAVIVPPELRKG